MKTVTIFFNAVDPTDRVSATVPDVCAFLKEQFGSWPDTARLYHNAVAATNEVTPHCEADIERLQSLDGHFFAVIWPEDPVTIAIVVAIAVAAIAIGVAFFMRPTVPNANDSSPNNELSDRQNKARPNSRIPDIYGTVRSTPDLLALPYKTFIANREVEVCYMCVGRGYHTIVDCLDDQTPVNEIEGEFVAVYPPFNSPNSAVPAPQNTFGIEPASGIPKVYSVAQSNAVNGQVVRPSNAGNFETNNNVAFQYGGVILCNDSNVDFQDYFVASTEEVPSYLTIYTNDDGANASDPAEAVHSVGLAGTYQILSVTANQITLSDPASVNSNWNVLATFSGQTSTYYHTFQITSATSLALGPYILNYPEMTEVWANFVGENGLYYVNSDGNQKPLTVTIQMQVQSVNSALEPVGEIVTGNVNVTGSAVDNVICGATLKLVLPTPGPCQVTVTRVTPMVLYHSNRAYVGTVQWRDLFGAWLPGRTVQETLSYVPTGARKALLTMTSTRISGIDCDGYADNITLKINGNGNLVVNGDAESGMTGWTNVTGAMGVTPYNGSVGNVPKPTSAAGSNFFYGGSSISVNQSIVAQLIDVSSYASDIDAGKASFYFAAYLGGFTNQGDNMSISLEWQDASNNSVGTDTIGPITNVDRGGVTQLILTSVGVDSSDIDFGNVTTLLSITAQTQDALSIKERKLNCLVTRNLPTWNNRTGFALTTGQTAPTFSSTLAPTNNAADILCAMVLDPFIGRRTIDELDVPGIYSVADSAYMGTGRADGAIAAYFGTFLMTEFCYTFDDATQSFEQMASLLAQAINCIAYRSAKTIDLSFEQKTSNSTMLYCHRNKIPDSETRTVSFGTLNNNDSVYYDYVDPNAPNYPNMEMHQTLYFPPTQVGTVPKRVKSVGVRNRVQAWVNGCRLYQKIIYACVHTAFEATQEANLNILNDRILVADNTRTGTQDGQVIAVDGTTITTSQDLTFVEGQTYTVYLQLADETTQAITVTPGEAPNQMVLAAAPNLPLVTDPKQFAQTTYVLISNSTTMRPLPFLVTKKEPTDKNTYNLEAMNYTDEYYSHDTDFSGGIIAAPAVGYGPQGYIGSGLGMADGTTQAATGTGFASSGDPQNNGGDPVTDAPPSDPPGTKLILINGA